MCQIGLTFSVIANSKVLQKNFYLGIQFYWCVFLQGQYVEKQIDIIIDRFNIIIWMECCLKISKRCDVEHFFSNMSHSFFPLIVAQVEFVREVFYHFVAPSPNPMVLRFYSTATSEPGQKGNSFNSVSPALAQHTTASEKLCFLCISNFKIWSINPQISNKAQIFVKLNPYIQNPRIPLWGCSKNISTGTGR